MKRQLRASSASSVPKTRLAVAVSAVLATVVAAAVLAAPASAKEIVGWFGTPSGTGSLGGDLKNPRDIGVNRSGAGPANPGDLYVVDENNHRVQRYDSTGNFISAWGANVVSEGINEVQLITVDAEGGTFTLSFGGATTPALSEASTAAQVQTALRNLVSIGSTNVLVSGAAGGPWTATFTGSFAITEVDQITADGTLLSGGAATVLVSTTTQGSGAYEICTEAASCRAGVATGAANATDAAKNGSLDNPQSVAVDNDTGNVYVADRDNRRVNVYDGVGNFIRSFGWDVDADEAATSYENCPAANRCQLGAAGDGAGQVGSIATAGTLGIAVSPADGEAAVGTVFLADSQNRRVNTYGLDGSSPSFFGSAATFGTAQPQKLAVDSRGIVYASNSEGNARVERYDTVDANGDGVGFLTPIEATAPAVNETQKITFASFVAGNTFTLTCPGGEPTGPITYATGSTGRTNINNGLIAACGANFSSSGNPPNTTVIFNGAFAQTDVPTMTCTTLTGAGSCSITEEANGHPVVPAALLQGGATATSGLVVDPDLDGGGPEVDILYVLRDPSAGNTVAQQFDQPGLTTAPTEEDAQHGAGASFAAVQGLGLDPVEDSLYVSAISNVSGSGAGHRVYVLAASPDPEPVVEAVEDVTPTSATIEGTVDPNVAPSFPNPPNVFYRLEYKLSSDSEWSAFTPNSNLGAGDGPVPVSTPLGGLRPNSDYDVRFLATREFVQGATYTSAPQSFTTLSAPPRVQSFTSTEVSATEADLHAKIDPLGLDSTYRFEYGTTTSYGNSVPVPDGEIAAGFGGQAVSAHISGLSSQSYHFRVVAENSAGTTTTDDQTFSFYPPKCPNETVRQQLNSAYLPDCRAYELVSPENANGTVFSPGGPYSAEASNPPRLAFVGAFANAVGDADIINNGGDLYVASRGATGWTTEYIGLGGSEAACSGGPPVTAYTAGPDKAQNGVITDFSMSRFLQWNNGNPNLCTSNGSGLEDGNTAAKASNAPYVWGVDNSRLGRWPTNLEAVSGAEEEFECPHLASSSPPPAASCTTGFTASADLSHFVFSTASGIFGEGGLSAAPGSAYDNDTEDGTVELISIKPGTENDPIEQEPGNTDPNELIQFPAISNDGSRILMATDTQPRCIPAFNSRCHFFTAPVHLYMRVDRETTYDVSAGHTVNYVDMSPDGSRVYFTSTEQLTEDDTDISRDLFMWTLDDQGAADLVRLSSGSGAAGNSDSCSAAWSPQCDIEVYSDVGYSETTGGNLGGRGVHSGKGTDNALARDSGDIYFYSPEQLDGASGVVGGVNLYVHRDGAPQYVTTLEDNPACIFIPEALGTSNETCSDGPLARLQVSPDGRWAALVTNSKLTGYENAGHTEMYLYDAEQDELTCVSCRPDGEPPTSEVFASQGGLFMTDDGRPFFSTEDPLVPADTNEGYDVYEYVEGRPHLITSGVGTTVAAGTFSSRFARPGLNGVSRDGTNVYFSTFDVLVPQDRNGNQLKFYAARTNGGFAFNPPPAPCEAADECHAGSGPGLAPLANGTAAALGAGGNVVHRVKKASWRKKRATRRKTRARKQRRKARARARAKARIAARKQTNRSRGGAR